MWSGDGWRQAWQRTALDQRRRAIAHARRFEGARVTLIRGERPKAQGAAGAGNSEKDWPPPGAHKLNDAIFYHLIYIFTFLCGLKLLADGLGLDLS